MALAASLIILPGVSAGWTPKPCNRATGLQLRSWAANLRANSARIRYVTSNRIAYVREELAKVETSAAEMDALAARCGRR
jgi:hypothetical protein